MNQVDILERNATPERILSWCDRGLEPFEEYRDQLEAALKLLSNRSGPGARFARKELKSALATMRATLAAVPSVEAEREGYRVAVERQRACQAAVQAATEVEALIYAEGAATLASRAVQAARELFAAAASSARLPSVERCPLYHGRRMYHAETHGTRALAGYAADLSEYRPAQGNTDGARRAYEACVLQGKTTEPEQMVFEVVAESEYRGERDRTEAFALRWSFFARRHGLPCEADATSDAAE